MGNREIRKADADEPEVPWRSGQVAAELGVSVWTVHNMANDGRLKPLAKLEGRTGGYLFARADVLALKASLIAEPAEDGAA